MTAGEQITEQQLLGGLLVHSADNYADLLARWDAGSIPAFVAKMNATAAALGMQQTHFADASGISTQSVSTAGDILKVAGPDMADPVVASIVDNNSVTLPVAGTLSTYTPLLGLDGIVGMKSGYTDAAGGCDVVAVIRPVHGHPTLLLAAVTGQTGALALAQAGLHGLALVNAAQPLIGTTTVLQDGAVAARAATAGSSVAARDRHIGVDADVAGRTRHPRVPSGAPPERAGPSWRTGGERRRHARNPARRRPGAPQPRCPAAFDAPAPVLSA